MPNFAQQQTRRLGLMVCAFGMFVVEMAALRLVSVVTWPPFAFLALSAAMLGGGAGATVLAIRPSWSRHATAPFYGALLLSVGAPLAAVAVHFSQLEPLLVGQAWWPTVRFSAVLLLLGVPFVGLSLCLTALLEQNPDDAFSLYGADLCGAAGGALFTGFFLEWLGTSATFAAGGCVAAVGALFLTDSTTKTRLVLAGAFLASLGTALFLSTSIPSFTAEKRIANRPVSDVLRQLQKSGRSFAVDGPDGRVDVIPGKPRSVLLIDGGAALARAPQHADVGLPPTKDPTSVAFAARPFKGRISNEVINEDTPRKMTGGGARNKAENAEGTKAGDAVKNSAKSKANDSDSVLVIGSAAGFEVHRALRYGAPHVDAVEVSEAVWRVATSDALPTAQNTFANARVANVHDEARSFLERSDKKWSHIIAIHTISNAAMASSAMRLAEDFLLTTEGMRAMVSHLQNDGVLYMTRPASQIDLLAHLARDALLKEGVSLSDVDKHLFLVAPTKPDPFFRGLLVFRSRLEGAPVPRLFLDAARLKLERPPLMTEIVLPTDRTPFFHRLSDSVDDKSRMRLQIEGPDLAERSVLWVGGLATLLALFALFLPLTLGERAKETGKTQEPSTPFHFKIALATALGIGLGFLLLEVNLVQRLSLFLGHPQTAYAIVLGGLLLGAGSLGLYFGRSPPALSRALFLATVACGFGLGLPVLLDVTGVLSLPFFARAGLCFLGAAITGAPLGLVFPALVQATTSQKGGNASWLFALNACASVAGSALNAVVGPRLGLDGAAAVALFIYAGLFGLTVFWPPSPQAGVAFGEAHDKMNPKDSATGATRP